MYCLVLGGAKCVFEDLERAKALLGEPEIVVAVKDIWIEYPKVDYVATYHLDRIPRELEKRRALGYEDPKCVWTYRTFRYPRIPLPLQTKKITGGSSGLLGTYVGLEYHDKVVLAGIPLDPTMPHYHNRKKGRPWKDANLYLKHWRSSLPTLLGKVKSMSGMTRELLGEPTKEWLHERNPDPTPSETPDCTESDTGSSGEVRGKR